MRDAWRPPLKGDEDGLHWVSAVLGPGVRNRWGFQEGAAGNRGCVRLPGGVDAGPIDDGKDTRTLVLETSQLTVRERFDHHAVSLQGGD